MKCTYLKQAAIGLALLGFACAASAQYIWLNEKGIKQFSDMPPPASVPKSRVLKEPGQALRSPAQAASDEPAAAADNQADAASAPKVPLTTAEKNAEFQKRRAEQAEKEKKEAEKEKLAADKAKNCARARDYQSALASGQRVARTDKNGERSYLSDEQRNQDIQEAKRILADCN